MGVCRLTERARQPADREVHSIAQKHSEQRLVDSYTVVVVDEAEPAKPIHEEVDVGSSGSDHLRQGFLGYLEISVSGSPGCRIVPAARDLSLSALHWS